MGTISKEMETLRKYPKEMLEVKTIVTKMKNAFVVFISKKIISKLEGKSIDT